MLTNLNKKIIYFFLIFNLTSLSSTRAKEADVDSINNKKIITDFYSQNLYQSFNDNIITQTTLTATNSKEWWNFYLGFLIDADTYSSSVSNDTDSQLALILGYKTPILFQSIPSRLFIEGRTVNRLHSFSDHRKRTDLEWRTGLYGYDFLNFNTTKEDIYAFFEHYYAFYFSRLYDKKFILQFWTKQGVRNTLKRAAQGGIHLDFFNEFVYDSFDISSNEEVTFDARPGMRGSIQFKQINLALSFQKVYHLSDLAQPRDRQWRTLLVLSGQF